jgi:hypothetical protein
MPQAGNEHCRRRRLIAGCFEPASALVFALVEACLQT